MAPLKFAAKPVEQGDFMNHDPKNDKNIRMPRKFTRQRPIYFAGNGSRNQIKLPMPYCPRS